MQGMIAPKMQGCNHFLSKKHRIELLNALHVNTQLIHTGFDCSSETGFNPKFPFKQVGNVAVVLMDGVDVVDIDILPGLNAGDFHALR